MITRGQIAEPPPDRVSAPGERHARRADRGGSAPAAEPQRGAAPQRRRRRPDRRPRRRLRAASTVLIAAGAFLVADAGATVVWEEPVTSLLTLREQAVLGGDLSALRTATPTTTERRVLSGLRGARERIAFLARALDRSAASGSAVGELRLPRVDERLVLVKGSSPSALRRAPGTYDGSGLPGMPGTAAIAGHRTTYGAPFRRIDELRPGDPIVVAMPYATFTYRVERTRIVRPTDLSVLARRRYDRLVLSACHPRYSAEQRIVVLARLERAVPAGTLAD